MGDRFLVISVRGIHHVLIALFLFVVPGSAQESKGQIFVDRAREWGLHFDHFNGMSGEHYFPEMTGQGGALLDYDNDGDLDAYLVQGTMLGRGKTLADALFPPAPDTHLSDRLFRNDFSLDADGVARPHFVDVTATSSIFASGYGMGVATGDIDNDGWVDLYVTNVGPNQLWHNRGDGTFEEIATESGVEDELWGTSAAFLDFDSDSWLDLYVANYVEFDLVRNPACYATSTRRDYCGPDAFEPQPDRLFRNRGDGTFEDVTSQRLAGYRPGPGLGVMAADFNSDRLMDLFVANDGRENQLWLGRADGTFVEEALFSGVAVNRDGRPEASMGVAVGDFDADGDEDLFLTHLMGETNTLYINDGSAVFTDSTLASGLSAPSVRSTSFGTGWIDFDNDGWLDLLTLSGAVRILEEQAAAGDLYPLKQPNQLYRNLKGRFVEVTQKAGPELALFEVSRGVAFGDVDNDGDTDLLIFNNNGPARLLENQVGAQASWVGLRARLSRATGDPGRDALGLRISVETGTGTQRTRRVHTDGSYCSARDPRVLLGLGTESAAHTVRADRSSGRAVEWRSPPLERYLQLRLASQ